MGLFRAQPKCFRDIGNCSGDSTIMVDIRTKKAKRNYCVASSPNMTIMKIIRRPREYLCIVFRKMKLYGRGGTIFCIIDRKLQSQDQLFSTKFPVSGPTVFQCFAHLMDGKKSYFSLCNIIWFGPFQKVD